VKADLESLTWPAAKLGEAIEQLARGGGLSRQKVEIPNPPALALNGRLDRWIASAVDAAGLEAEPVEVRYGEAEAFLRGAAPAIVPLRFGAETRYLALADGGRRPAVISPDLTLRRVAVESIASVMCRDLEAPHVEAVERLLERAGVRRGRLARARARMLAERLSQSVAQGGWLIRMKPGASFWQQLKRERLPRRLYTLGVAYSLQYLLILTAWWVLGKAALGDQLDRGWLVAWALLLLTAVPLRILAVRAQGLFAIGAGSLLKKRLLYGALRLEPEEVRHKGAGQMLGQVIESTAVESLALSGGFLGLVALIELAMSALVLLIGAGGLFHTMLLGAWVALAVAVARVYLGRRREWTGARLGMTNDLIERMVGHRTRLAQEPRSRWHDGEDQTVEHYLERSRAMDRTWVLQAAMSRGWLVAGVAGLAPAFIDGSGTPPAIAISIGGVMLGSRALQKLIAGLVSLTSAAIAWGEVRLLFDAATRREDEAAAMELERRGQSRSEAVMEAHAVTFQYQGRGAPVLRGVDLTIRAGDRLLLRGSSGGGKSTFAALLSGLRAPDTGLLLLGGLDHKSVGGAAWRERVVAAPQFHENHVLTATFAFNLLMGRRWPPTAKDFQEAEAICRELGLGQLLERMPAGLLQMVGETGWQLSHGERSRLFMARALLQEADLIILDESFAALDPENLRQCLTSVLGRAPTLLVIAHP
jgi:ATP-binding cassette subfamily B protein